MTPLNGVLGVLQLIEAEADTIRPDELRDLLGLIREGAERQQVLSRKLVLHYELERLKAVSLVSPLTPRRFTTGRGFLFMACPCACPTLPASCSSSFVFRGTKSLAVSGEAGIERRTIYLCCEKAAK